MYQSLPPIGYQNHQKITDAVYYLLFSSAGELHVPLDVCGAVVKRELDFWGIDEGEIESCCWISYSSYIDNQKNLAEFNENIVIEDNSIDPSIVGWQRIQYKIWMILDHPRSSNLALVGMIMTCVKNISENMIMICNLHSIEIYKSK